MRKLSKRELIILVLSLVLIMVFVAFKFVLMPMREHGSDVTDNIDFAKRKLEKHQQIIRSGAKIDEQYNRLAAYLGVSESEGAEFSVMISQLESLARESNIHVANVQPQKGFGKEFTRTYPVELDIDGAWPAIAKFLYLVQVHPNFFKIDELDLEKYSDTVASLRGRIVLSRIRVVNTN